MMGTVDCNVVMLGRMTVTLESNEDSSENMLVMQDEVEATWVST
jgi:hypothetical protein